jgi:hypothetical protein
VPQAGSTLTFPSTFVNTQQINDLGSGIVFNSIVFNGSFYQARGQCDRADGGCVGGHGGAGQHSEFAVAIALVGEPVRSIWRQWRYKTGRSSGSGRVRGQGMGTGPGLAGHANYPIQWGVDGEA